MTQIDGAGQQDTDNQNAEALQAALAQREVTAQAQPQGGSDVPSHQNSDPIERRIGNSTAPSGSYQKTSCTVSLKKNTAEMIRMMALLVEQYHDRRKLYLSWDAASWHISKRLGQRIEEHNAAVLTGGGPTVETSRSAY